MEIYVSTISIQCMQKKEILLFSLFLFSLLIRYIFGEDVICEIKYIKCEEQIKYKLCTRAIMQNPSEIGG